MMFHLIESTLEVPFNEQIVTFQRLEGERNKTSHCHLMCRTQSCFYLFGERLDLTGLYKTALLLDEWSDKEKLLQ